MSNLSVCGTDCGECYCYGKMCTGCNECEGRKGKVELCHQIIKN